MRLLSPAGVSGAWVRALGAVLCLRPLTVRSGRALKYRLVPLAAMIACSLMVSACSMRMPHIWPFYKKVKAGPAAGHELNLVNADGTPASHPQYWKRNTLVIDLSGVSGTGGVAARLPEETTWPVRVAVRVRPGSV